MSPSEALAYWQSALGLQDWRIELREGVSRKDLDVASRRAEIEYSPATLEASLLLRDPSDVSDTPELCSDSPEVLVVHELLHLRLTDCPTQVGDDHEAGICFMSRLLVRWRKEREVTPCPKD